MACRPRCNGYNWCFGAHFHISKNSIIRRKILADLCMASDVFLMSQAMQQAKRRVIITASGEVVLYMGVIKIKSTKTMRALRSPTCVCYSLSPLSEPDSRCPKPVVSRGNSMRGYVYRIPSPSSIGNFYWRCYRMK